MIKKIYNIEFLRVVLCISIVLVHLSRCLRKLFPDNELFAALAQHCNNAPKAVDGFFILSGIFLYLTYKSDMPVIDFLKKKIIRLSPVVVFSIILGGVFSCFHLMRFNFDVAFLYGTFTIMITDFKKVYHMGLGSLWYVSVLFWVCLFYFTLLKYFTKDKNNNRVNFIIGLITILSYYICIRINRGGFTAPEYNHGIFSVGFLRGFAGIGTGYFLGYWYLAKSQKADIKIYLSWTILEVSFLFLVIYNLYIHPVAHIYDFNIILYQIFLIFCFLNNKGAISKFLDNSYWCYLSRYCYSIYILHQLTFFATKKIVANLANNLEIMLIVFGVPVILGILCYHFIEVPSANYLKNRWFRSKL